MKKAGGTYYVKAYAILKGNIKTKEIGRLSVECQDYKDSENKIRIIRVKRSDETDYAPFSAEQKVELINRINTYYKQAFIKFELDTENYNDTLTIQKSSEEVVDKTTVRAIYKSLSKEENVYYILICSRGKNTNNGSGGYPPARIAMLFQPLEATPVHELGHNLGLQHTFENQDDQKATICKVGNRKLPTGSTKNIMDYTGIPDKRRYFFLYQINHLKTK
jgi:hypothetical protein